MMNSTLKVLSELVEGRGNIYSFLSGSYLSPPSKETIDLILDNGFLEGMTEIFDKSAVHDLVAFTRDFNGDYYELRQEYHNLFVVPAGQYVTPYEAVYRDSRIIAGSVVKGLLMGESTIDVKRMYKRAGAEITRDYKDLPDHIGMELLFMHFLCEREKEAWKAEDESIVLDYLKREQEFIHKHLIQWVPDLCDRICEKTKNRYFKGIAKITDAFIRTEDETLNSIFD